MFDRHLLPRQCRDIASNPAAQRHRAQPKPSLPYSMAFAFLSVISSGNRLFALETRGTPSLVSVGTRWEYFMLAAHPAQTQQRRVIDAPLCPSNF